MPIYEYRCASCGFQNEYLRKRSDPVFTVCPECGKKTFKKLLTAAGFQLKGSGWYASDFKQSGAKPAAKKDGEAKPDAGAKQDGEAKPDAGAKQDGAAKPDGGAKQSETASATSGAGACPAGS